MSKKVIESGQSILLMDQVVSHETLPGGFYKLNWNEESGQVWLERSTEFKKPSKVYGFDDEIRVLVKSKFMSQDRNLGMLLTGTKGQGKTFTARMVMMDLGLPVISITRSIPKSIDFVSFLAGIPGEFSLFIDEFEKLFPIKDGNQNQNHTQESFLGFMDGMPTAGKIMFVLTSNEPVSDYLINRPSRITFLKEYNDMAESVFDTIVEDLLEDKSMLEDLKSSVSLLNLNVDLLVSIIKDINLFKRPFSEFSSMYNYRMEMYKWDVYEEVNGQLKFMNTLRVQDRPTHKTTYYASYQVSDILKLSGEEFVFTSNVWRDVKNEKGEEDSVQVKVTVHLKRVTSTKFSLTA